MNIQKIVDALTGVNYRFSTRQQLFNFYISLSVLLYGIAVITVMALDLNEWYGIASVSLQVINILIWYFAVIKHRYSQSIYIFIGINSAAIVILFFVNGGWNGPMPMGIMVALFLVLYLIPKSWHALVISYAILAAIGTIEYFFPEWVIPYPDADTARISYISAAALLTFFMYAGFVITQKKMIENIDAQAGMLKQSKDEAQTLLEELQTHQEELSTANEYLQKISKKFNDSQRKYYDLLTQLKAVVYRWKFEPNGKAHIEFISNGCLEITGYNASDFTSNKIDYLTAIIHPEDKEKTWSQIQNCIEASRAYNVTYRIITADKQIKWVQEKGEAVYENHTPVFLDGFITDVTDMVVKQQPLQLLNELINASNTATLVVNSHEQIVYAGKSIEELLGIELESLIYKKISEVRFLNLPEFKYAMLQTQLLGEFSLSIDYSNQHDALTKIALTAKKIVFDNSNYYAITLRHTHGNSIPVQENATLPLANLL